MRLKKLLKLLSNIPGNPRVHLRTVALEAPAELIEMMNSDDEEPDDMDSDEPDDEEVCQNCGSHDCGREEDATGEILVPICDEPMEKVEYDPSQHIVFLLSESSAGILEDLAMQKKHYDAEVERGINELEKAFELT